MAIRDKPKRKKQTRDILRVGTLVRAPDYLIRGFVCDKPTFDEVKMAVEFLENALEMYNGELKIEVVERSGEYFINGERYFEPPEIKATFTQTIKP